MTEPLDNASASELSVELSIVIPALNEQDNVEPLVEQVESAVRDAGIDAELIVVDDGSDDLTLSRLKELAADRPWLVPLHRDKPQGQSSAMHAGIAAARGRYVATLDADLQNDPGELPAMLELLQRENADMVQGDRSADRQDTFVRRWGSVVGRKTRLWLLGDPVRDTGCSARVVKAEYAKRLPLQYKGMHRFIPCYVAALGGVVIEMPVRHRPRHSGTTKYGMGLLSRGPAGLVDCFAVRWMRKRLRDVAVQRMA
ncbi:MAG: glycosyltransferase family 2 protein [Phycisphaeraceae bacterium]